MYFKKQFRKMFFMPKEIYRYSIRKGKYKKNKCNGSRARRWLNFNGLLLVIAINE
jgi:hypothetical protein